MNAAARTGLPLAAPEGSDLSWPMSKLLDSIYSGARPRQSY